ncbi:hypothetical protein DFS34DRAFT_466317 [Phlyctochytrium arcticum]|nr:hypothetical protein DFS34DRAFT_466317 [Phlyctochytrium arcticum]
MVEFSSQGVRYPPAVTSTYRPMGDNTYKKESFANMCVYDFFNKTGYAADAATWYNTLMSTTQDNVPSGAVAVNWFKNWFLPLYQEHSNTMSFQTTYDGLLAQYFPTTLDGAGITSYVRTANEGEYVHFMSAAVGRSLEGMASVLFNTGWKPAQFAAARTTFPVLTAMYPYP